MFFWNSLAFFNDPLDVGNLISGSSAFFKTNLRRAETKRKKEFNILQGKNSTFLNPQTQSLKTKQNKKILKGREILHK